MRNNSNCNYLINFIDWKIPLADRPHILFQSLLNHDKLRSKSNKSKKNIIADINCKNDLSHLPIVLEKEKRLIENLNMLMIISYILF